MPFPLDICCLCIRRQRNKFAVRGVVVRSYGEITEYLGFVFVMSLFPTDPYGGAHVSFNAYCGYSMCRRYLWINDLCNTSVGFVCRKSHFYCLFDVAIAVIIRSYAQPLHHGGYSRLYVAIGVPLVRASCYCDVQICRIVRTLKRSECVFDIRTA